MTSIDDVIAARRDRYQRTAIAIQEPVFRFVRRRASAEVADHVMADTLLVLWRRLDDVTDGGELPFCLGVARRSLANQLRSVHQVEEHAAVRLLIGLQVHHRRKFGQHTVALIQQSGRGITKRNGQLNV